MIFCGNCLLVAAHQIGMLVQSQHVAHNFKLLLIFRLELYLHHQTRSPWAWSISNSNTSSSTFIQEQANQHEALHPAPGASVPRTWQATRVPRALAVIRMLVRSHEVHLHSRERQQQLSPKRSHKEGTHGRICTRPMYVYRQGHNRPNGRVAMSIESTVAQGNLQNPCFRPKHIPYDRGTTRPFVSIRTIC